MTTSTITEHAEAIRAELVEELPVISGVGILDCPCCRERLTPMDFHPTYDELNKLRGWTIAQAVAFRRLQDNSGIEYRDLLTATAVQARPGIGAIYNPTVLGVNMNGLFVGIEPDGHTHS